MKNDMFSFVPSAPSLFQIASFFDDFFPAEGLQRSASSLKHLPFAELMVNPEALMKLLRSGNTEVHAATTEKNQAAKRAPRNNNTSKKPASQGGGKTNGSSGGTPKKIEFTFKAPTAASVLLAGDFTDWDKRPMEMTHSDDGFWSTVVPLMPGAYSYRFIVDGCWCDDPASGHQEPNPFGGRNAIIRVT